MSRTLERVDGRKLVRLIVYVPADLEIPYLVWTIRNRMNQSEGLIALVQRAVKAERKAKREQRTLAKDADAAKRPPADESAAPSPAPRRRKR